MADKKADIKRKCHKKDKNKKNGLLHSGFYFYCTKSYTSLKMKDLRKPLMLLLHSFAIATFIFDFNIIAILVLTK